MLVLHKQETEAGGGSRSGVGVEITLIFHNYYFLESVCDWRASKGVARKSRGKQRYTEEGGGGGGAGWSFSQSTDTPFVALVHSNLHTQYAAAVW